MTTHLHVPADDDADSLAELLLDCAAMPDGMGAAAPLHLPARRPAGLVLLEQPAADMVDGMGDYGV